MSHPPLAPKGVARTSASLIFIAMTALAAVACSSPRNLPPDGGRQGGSGGHGGNDGGPDAGATGGSGGIQEDGGVPMGGKGAQGGATSGGNGGIGGATGVGGAFGGATGAAGAKNGGATATGGLSGAAGINGTGGGPGGAVGAGGQGGAQPTGGAGGSPALCTKTTCSSVCVDPSSDAKNCGTCGHDCLGGACSGGKCQPTMLGRYLGSGMSLQVSSERACESDDISGIGCAKKDGSDLRPISKPGETQDGAIGMQFALDGSRLIFTRSSTTDQLNICEVGSCEQTAVGFGGQHIRDVAVDATAHKIYWFEGTTLYTSSTIGTPVPSKMVDTGIATGGWLPLVYQNNNVLFVSSDRGHIYRQAVNTVSTPPAPVDLGPGSVAAANSSGVFWSDTDGFHVIALPNGLIGGDNQLVLASTRTYKFAVDETMVYWPKDTGVARCKISNCAATVENLPGPAADPQWNFSGTADVKVDESAIYFIVDGGWITSPTTAAVATAIFKIAK